MLCPKCKGKTKVIDTNHLDKRSGIRRRRICLVCGHRFNTFEILVTDLEIYEKLMQIELQLAEREKYLKLFKDKE